MRERRSVLAVVLGLAAVACNRNPVPGDSGPRSAAPIVADRAPPRASAAPSASVASAPPSASAQPERPPLPAPERPPPRPEALIATPPRPGSAANAGFRGPVDAARDGEWLARLASAPVTEIVRNPGGATLTLRVRFADGQRAVFKPDQQHSASNYRSEIAAYHVDRLLGFGRTAAVAGRSFAASHLFEHLEHAATDATYLERFEHEIVSHNGRVAGAMIAWHSGKLTGAEPPKGFSDHLRSKEPPPPEVAARLPEWSDLVVFDFLIDNTDRWSGGNVLALGAGGPLIFLDNAAGFSTFRASHGDTLASKLEPVCRFRRATRDALVAVGPAAPADERLGAELRSSLAKDPLAPVLAERNFSAIDERVGKLVAHIQKCVDELGEETVLLSP